MALVKCKECGNQVSTKAKACPTCGAKVPKKTSIVTWCVLGVIVLVVGNAIINPAPPKPPKTQEQIAQEAESAKLKEEESKRRTERAIAESRAKESVLALLKDPDSAKFGTVVVTDSGIVCGYVNAKNSFGGYTGEKPFISMGGTQATWIQGNVKDFEKTWNKYCVTH